ncbi:MAG: hypothetical protein Q9O62_02830 [Ardenticatenia bacterium]|nr:hypothetical protein [Ardenticatenia bacterium]
MNGVRAFGLALRDVWEEIGFLIMVSLAGGALSALVVPVPFVLAAHYGAARRIAEGRVVGWREWLQQGRKHARFFYAWAVLLATTTSIAVLDVRFYLQQPSPPLFLLAGLIFGALAAWLFVQPLVPALYLEQADRRLRLALRNATVLAAQDVLSVAVLWAVTVGLTVLLTIAFPPLMVLMPAFVALVSVRLVRLHLGHTHV